jgi:undecaprenyl-diphosphatase
MLSLVIAHSLYPLGKSYIGRPRPIDRDPTLTSLVTPLDAYSCPSGHCMTAVAVFIPIGFSLSTTVLPLTILALLIAWARLAAAHHYPTDLISGSPWDQYCSSDLLGVPVLVETNA